MSKLIETTFYVHLFLDIDDLPALGFTEKRRYGLQRRSGGARVRRSGGENGENEVR